MEAYAVREKGSEKISTVLGAAVTCATAILVHVAILLAL